MAVPQQSFRAVRNYRPRLRAFDFAQRRNPAACCRARRFACSARTFQNRCCSGSCNLCPRPPMPRRHRKLWRTHLRSRTDSPRTASCRYGKIRLSRLEYLPTSAHIAQLRLTRREAASRAGLSPNYEQPAFPGQLQTASPFLVESSRRRLT
jgi:hypothetical protein